MGKKKKSKPFHSELTPEGALARVRGFLLDSQAKNAHEISLVLGCPPISDEVLEREEEESDLRIEEILYLAPILYSFSEMLVEGSLSYQKIVRPEMAKLDDDVWTETKKMMEQISRAVLVGAIAQLVDMGQLRVSKRQAKKTKGKKHV